MHQMQIVLQTAATKNLGGSGAQPGNARTCIGNAYIFNENHPQPPKPLHSGGGGELSEAAPPR